VNSTQGSAGMFVTVGGTGITSRSGTAGARMLLDRIGLPAALSGALAGTTSYPGLSRGRVLADLAVTIADGGTRLRDLDTLADQQELFGPVASAATGWRVLAEASTRLGEIADGRAAVRAHVWEQIAARHGRIPPSTVAGTDLGEFVVLRVDATIVIAHSDKEDAAGTFKKTYGHHLLTVWCDNTGECLVLKLRPGNAGSNTADDHLEVLDAAIAQLPARYRDRLLVTVDGAGSSHALVRYLDRLGNDPDHPERTLYYAVGFDVDERVRSVVPEQAWAASVRTNGEPRRNGQVAELTGLLREGPDGDRTRSGRKACAWSRGVSGHRPARSSPCSSSTRGSGSRSPRRTCPRATRSRSWRPSTVCRPGWRGSSDVGRTPDFVASRRSSRRSTRGGVWRSPWPVTCSPGCACSRSTETWRGPSRGRCATGSCTSPRGSSAPAGAVRSASRDLALGERDRRDGRPDPGPARPHLTAGLPTPTTRRNPRAIS